MKKVDGKALFLVSLCSMALLSATFLLMPFASDHEMETGSRLYLIIVGILFWLLSIVSYGVLIILNQQRKRKTGKLKTGSRRPGIFCFFSNKTAALFDVLMIGSVIGFLICMVTSLAEHYISYILLFLLVLSAQMHGMFNGKNYRYVSESNRRSEKDHE